MATLERAGFYQDAGGLSFLLTQGLSGSTLVAGKQCLFRLFMDQATISQADYVVATISGGAWKAARGFIIPKSDFLVETAYPNGPSIGFVIRGWLFPEAGQYTVALSARAANNAVLMQPAIEPLKFLPTKDLRFLVALMFHEGFFAPTDDWTKDVAQSMLRLGSMFPVRDCVQSELNGHRNTGIRYKIGTMCDGWAGGYYDCVYGQTQKINASTGDHIDVTIEFRWGFYPPDYNPPGDPNPGGNSGRPPAPYNNLRRASCVAGPYLGTPMTAPCFAQEIGHNFGLEPPGSPHYQDPIDPGHSKDGLIIDPFAFDFVNHRPYTPAAPGRFLGDVMNNMGAGAWQGADWVLFNAYDWEYLRQQLVLLESTGTESNAAISDPCGPVAASVPKPPAEYHHLIGSRADGPLWEWGPHGLHPVPPRGPEVPQARPSAEGVLSALKELEKARVEAVYLPFGREPLSLIGRLGSTGSLDRPHLNVGGKV